MSIFTAIANWFKVSPAPSNPDSYNDRYFTGSDAEAEDIVSEYAESHESNRYDEEDWEPIKSSGSDYMDYDNLAGWYHRGDWDSSPSISVDTSIDIHCSSSCFISDSSSCFSSWD